MPLPFHALAHSRLVNPFPHRDNQPALLQNWDKHIRRQHPIFFTGKPQKGFRACHLLRFHGNDGLVIHFEPLKPMVHGIPQFFLDIKVFHIVGIIQPGKYIGTVLPILFCHAQCKFRKIAQAFKIHVPIGKTNDPRRNRVKALVALFLALLFHPASDEMVFFPRLLDVAACQQYKEFIPIPFIETVCAAGFLNALGDQL